MSSALTPDEREDRDRRIEVWQTRLRFAKTSAARERALEELQKLGVGPQLPRQAPEEQA